MLSKLKLITITASTATSEAISGKGECFKLNPHWQENTYEVF